MAVYPRPLSALIEELQKLPGVGPKSAQRLAFFILKMPKEDAANLAGAILHLKDSINTCVICGNVTAEEKCEICNNSSRDTSLLCVVENSSDIIAIEKTGKYKGVYHVLMGRLSPLEGIGPDKLNTGALVSRVSNNSVKEVIIATNPDSEGDITAIYISKLLKPLKLKITRLAHGLPVGVDLEYADEVTLSHAINGRREV